MGEFRDWPTPPELIQLTRRLQAEGFTDEDLAKIWGGNFLRVMTRVQAAAQG